MFETIIALASGPLKAALAIIRLSGDDCFSIVEPIFTKKFDDNEKKEILFGYIHDGDTKIDQVVLLKYKAPHSFTGENSVEIICHGSMLIAKQIIDLCLKRGARLATNGEFSSRAFLNNKVDLVQAEAINDLINASTKESKSLFLYALEGEVSKDFYPIKEKLADILSNIEVNIDYPEYLDIERVNKEKIIEVCGEIREKIAKFLVDTKKAIRIKDGVNVALIGKPNVGKSSLLNALINEDKAIVTEIEGTTRDVVEGDFVLNGIPIHLFDTAGQREASNKVEQIGIDKAKETIKKCDLIIYVVDEDKLDDELLTLFKEKPYIVVYNKADLIDRKEKNHLYISALNKDIEPLLNAMKEALGIEEKVDIVPSFNNSRQLGLLEKIDVELSEAINLSKEDSPIDIISINLMEAYNAMLDLVGESNKNDLSEEIFSRFCVGK